MTVNTWNVTSGATLYAGRAAPASAYDWLTEHRAAVGLNAWRPISGTAGGGGTAFDEYSGATLDADGNPIVGGGGHHSANNQFAKLVLNQNRPSYTTVSVASNFADVTPGGPYDASGKGTARHTRYQMNYDPKTGLVIFSGALNYYNFPSTNNDGTTAAFDPLTGIWKPAGYFPDVPGAAVNGCGWIDENGFIGGAGNRRLDTLTRTWTTRAASGDGAAIGVRYPSILAKGYVLFLCWADGWGNGTGVNCVKKTGDFYQKITFNPSAALTKFSAEAPIEAAMTFVDDGSAFGYALFYSGCAATDGGPGSSMTTFKIIPNASTVWDMEEFAFSTAYRLPPSPGGLQSRFKMLPQYGGVIAFPSQDTPAHYMQLIAP